MSPCLRDNRCSGEWTLVPLLPLRRNDGLRTQSVQGQAALEPESRAPTTAAAGWPSLWQTSEARVPSPSHFSSLSQPQLKSVSPAHMFLLSPSLQDPLILASQFHEAWSPPGTHNNPTGHHLQFLHLQCCIADRMLLPVSSEACCLPDAPSRGPCLSSGLPDHLDGMTIPVKTACPIYLSYLHRESKLDSQMWGRA